MGFRVETDVMVPMRDGVTLATDVWIPDGDEPRPTLLVRLPYGKNQFPQMMYLPSTPSLVEAGYCVVWQDCRGMFRSKGDFRPNADDDVDGADTIAWIRAQRWCDGTVGMYGLSYLGMTQWAAASESPEGLGAIVPTVTTTDLYSTPWYGPGGVPHWHTVLTWSVQQSLLCELSALAKGTGDVDTLIQLSTMLAGSDALLAKLPMTDHPLLEKTAPWLSEWLGHPDRDEFWVDDSVLEHLDRVQVPALHVAGWFDLFVDSAARTYARMKTDGGSEAARSEQRLIIGPWDHLNQEGVYHDRNFGPMATAYAADLAGAHVRFYDRHLRGYAEAHTGAPVRIFVMGIDQWRDEQDWPLPDTQYVDYHLDGAGGLTTQLPATDASDSYEYDPADPVPTLGGRLIMPVPVGTGPVDQRPVEERPDVLCFTTPVLDEPVEVTGHVSLVLHVSSSAPDTDFTGKLVDVFPDGRAMYLTDGILRARYRTSLAEPELLTPDQTYEVTIDLSVTSNVFLPGHAIRLEVSSSSFPRYARNTNTGGVIAEDGPDQLVVATNRVFHGPSHPSRLVLPIIPTREA
jgi:putative CocE/NonD family hydrolase